jgi:ankyrin repeat protein
MNNIDNSSTSLSTSNQYELIYCSASKGDLTTLKLAISNLGRNNDKSNADYNIVLSQALHASISNDRIAICNYLLSISPQLSHLPFYSNNRLVSPLYLAFTIHSIPIIYLLLSAGAKIDSKVILPFIGNWCSVDQKEIRRLFSLGEPMDDNISFLRRAYNSFLSAVLVFF